jgi:3-mercaptopyruvate sulfurtransferase SseA
MFFVSPLLWQSIPAEVLWYAQVAHIPGALFFDIDGIVDRTTDVRKRFQLLIIFSFMWSS